jgi:adenosylcobinamide kinase / adenosylcobinamide-phosphate guanylyltransferase
MSAETSKSRVILILGGVRSGKSRYAQQLAAAGERVAFVATAEGRDEEMAQRIARHREDRPSTWTTIEAPIEISDALLSCDGKFDTILVDCLTLWASNLMEREQQDSARIAQHIDRLASTLPQIASAVILVSNEVGSGIVPDNEMGRAYRDVLGSINQQVAAVADEVLLLVAGCPLVVKQHPDAVTA